jgi:hypothetical protein
MIITLPSSKSSTHIFLSLAVTHRIIQVPITNSARIHCTSGHGFPSPMVYSSKYLRHFSRKVKVNGKFVPTPRLENILGE